MLTHHQPRFSYLKITFDISQHFDFKSSFQVIVFERMELTKLHKVSEILAVFENKLKTSGFVSWNINCFVSLVENLELKCFTSNSSRQLKKIVLWSFMFMNTTMYPDDLFSYIYQLFDKFKDTMF